MPIQIAESVVLDRQSFKEKMLSNVNLPQKRTLIDSPAVETQTPWKYGAVEEWMLIQI